MYIGLIICVSVELVVLMARCGATDVSVLDHGEVLLALAGVSCWSRRARDETDGESEF